MRKIRKTCFLLHKKSDHVTSLLETFQQFPIALGIKSKSNMSHDLNLIRGRECVSVTSSRPISCGSQDMVASFIINLISLSVIYMPQREVINLNEYLAKKKKKPTKKPPFLPSSLLLFFTVSPPPPLCCYLPEKNKQIKKTSLPPIHVGFLLKKYDLLDL